MSAAPANLTETQAMDTIAAMGTTDAIKALLRSQWVSDAPGARVTVASCHPSQAASSTPEAIYREANAAHLAVARAIGASTPRPRKGSPLDVAFHETHEARRLAFFAVTAARKSEGG